jgi:hypothetical protein
MARLSPDRILSTAVSAPANWTHLARTSRSLTNLFPLQRAYCVRIRLMTLDIYLNDKSCFYFPCGRKEEEVVGIDNTDSLDTLAVSGEPTQIRDREAKIPCERRG